MRTPRLKARLVVTLCYDPFQQWTESAESALQREKTGGRVAELGAGEANVAGAEGGKTWAAFVEAAD